MGLRIGLTGGIASGKSTVARRLAELGAVVIDADVLAREVVEPGTPGLAAIIDRFGTDVLAADGRLDRARLGRLVFADPAARRDLEAIVHPAVRARAVEREQAAPPDAVVVQVIPLLVETQQQRNFDQIWVVDCRPEIQIDRMMARDGLTHAEAQARIAAQAGRDERLAVADVVIDSNGAKADTAAQVARAWSALSRSLVE